MSQGSSSSSADIKRLAGNAIATNAGAVDDGTLRVHLSAESLSALENISITVPGTIDLGSVSLNALETITVEQTDATKMKATAIITDGTNSATVKAASTQAATTDKALVVAISPNNTVAVTQSGTWNLSNISGTISLPTGAATAANQATEITSLQLLDDVVATAAAAALTKGYQVAGTDGTNARILALDTTGALKLATGSNSIGTVVLGSGSASVGTVVLGAGSAAVGTVVIGAGSAAIGTVELGATSLAALETTTVGVSGTVTVEIAAGTNNIGDVDVLSLVPGTGASNLGKAVDSAAGSTDTGVLAVVVRDDALTALSPADGDYTQLRVDATGRLWGSVTIDAALPAGSNTIGAVTLAAAQTLANVTTVGTVNTVTNLAQLGGQAIAMGTGVRTAGTQRVTIATDDALNVSFTPAAKTNNTTSAYASSLLIKGSAGTLFMVNGFNSATADQFIQIHDATDVPANGSAPKLTFFAPAESNFYFDFGIYGRAFTTGIVICNSSTGATKTIGSANCWFDAQYS